MRDAEIRGIRGGRDLAAGVAFASALVITGPFGALAGVPILGCVGLPLYLAGLVGFLVAAGVYGGGVSPTQEIAGGLLLVIASAILVYGMFASLTATSEWLLSHHRGDDMRGSFVPAIASAVGSSLVAAIGAGVRRSPRWPALIVLPLPILACTWPALCLVILDHLGVPLTA